MLPLNVTLSYYKRRDIQEEIIKAAKNMEIAVRFDDKFGSRPDVLNNPNDILELAKQKATSFHASEELWSNPLQLNPNMKKNEMDSLRIGWDLVLDIDCPMWELSRLITWLVIESLKEHNIKAISVKFSGNKGFHVGIPFESFPIKINKIPTKELFPYAPQKITLYLLDYISSNHIKIENEKIIFGKKNTILLKDIIEATKKSMDELTTRYCSRCNEVIKKEREKRTEFLCKKCGSVIVANEPYMKCIKCNIFMEKFESGICNCGSNDYSRKFNTLSVLNIDTILISSRHLYRIPYSLHEKSGLVSLPLDQDDVLRFKKDSTKPENVKISEFKFLDRENVVKGEASRLIVQAFDFNPRVDEIDFEEKKKFEILEDAVPEELFPPCIKLGLAGLKDGRKRFVFVLINFLVSAGWDYDSIEKRLKEWNKKNPELLREVNLLGQLRYHKQQKKKILPPNCNNSAYYLDIGICKPDNLCNKIKNPVIYVVRKSKHLEKDDWGKKNTDKKDKKAISPSNKKQL